MISDREYTDDEDEVTNIRKLETPIMSIKLRDNQKIFSSTFFTQCIE